MGTNGQLRKLPYDPLADFASLILAATAPNVLVAHPSVGAKNVAKPLMQADVKERRAREGAQPAGGTPAQFGAYLKSKSEKWAKVVRVANIRVE